MPAVEITGLVKRYGSRSAVDGLSLTAPEGAVTALLGPNGAGKTTTVQVCTGLRRADAGVVTVLGRPVEDPSLRWRVAAMPQSGGAYPSMPAGELLRLFAAYHRDPLDPALLLERLGLVDAARTPWRRLSGGQQQRLSLAMAVVGRPELVFLDEPTAGLDVQARRATWDLVEALRRDGTSVVLTTHAMEEAERLADHVVVVDHGREVAAGSVRELTSGTAQVSFRARPGLPVAELAGLREAAPGHYLLEGRGDPQAVADVSAWCATHGVAPEGLRAGQSLEDLFVALTGTELRG